MRPLSRHIGKQRSEGDLAGYLSLGTMQMYYHVTNTTLPHKMGPRSTTRESGIIPGRNVNAMCPR